LRWHLQFGGVIIYDNVVKCGGYVLLD
jgi:hypothetical protein